MDPWSHQQSLPFSSRLAGTLYSAIACPSIGSHVSLGILHRCVSTWLGLACPINLGLQKRAKKKKKKKRLEPRRILIMLNKLAHRAWMRSLSHKAFLSQIIQPSRVELLTFQHLRAVTNDPNESTDNDASAPKPLVIDPCAKPTDTGPSASTTTDTNAHKDDSSSDEEPKFGLHDEASPIDYGQIYRERTEVTSSLWSLRENLVKTHSDAVDTS